MGARGAALFVKEAWISEKTGKSGFGNVVQDWIMPEALAANYELNPAAPEKTTNDDLPF
mgnify:FL=1